ncbi:MAG: hypothetical protein JXB18_01475 [Sedimentisphaerales bacterium]|nr:hypothetical protein [Sedimentisphaerales bacterium]
MAISYEWFSSADNANNTLTDDISVQGPGSLAVLTLSNVQAANEKYYYCKVSNTAGGVYSAPAGLEVKRLVAYYAFENTLEDSSGNGNHGTDPNGSSFAGGVTGGTSALVLDASQHQYVELPAVAYPKAGLGGGMAAGTISMWVKPTQADRSVLMCGLGEAGKTGFALYKYTDTQAQMFIRNETGQAVTPTGGTVNLVASGWHHVAATWQSQGQVKVYIDGIQAASSAGITSNFVDWPYPHESPHALCAGNPRPHRGPGGGNRGGRIPVFSSRCRRDAGRFGLLDRAGSGTVKNMVQRISGLDHAG